ncbi:MAG: lysylphosphatidylglycerol synthase domain-containing protein [Clostridia bacterium]
MKSKQKKSLQKALSMLLFVVLLVLLIAYVYKNRADMQKLLNLNAATVALLLLLALGGCVMNCVYHLILLKTYPITLSLTDWMGVVFVANAMAYVLPMRADLVFSAAYYKRVKGLAYVKSVSMAAGNIIFGILFALLQMLAALLCTGLIEGSWSPVLWTLLMLGLFAMAALVVLSLLCKAKKPAWLQKIKLLNDVIDGFNALLCNKTMLWRLLVCLTVNNLIQLCLYMACFRAIGLEITFYQALFYNSVSWLASIVAIVPGNIGIKEGIMGVAMGLMGELFQNGVAVSLLQRVAVMVVYVVMGLAFAIPVWRNWSRAGNEERALR